MFFIGICGPSGSGKTTLARQLTELSGIQTTIINQDAYYFNHPDMSFEEREKLNYDEPDIFDHDLLYEDVCALLAGETIYRKNYDFALHARADSHEMVRPGDVLIVEGIHAFYDRRLLEKMDLRLYISVDPDICLLRRISRDIKDRGRNIDNISQQYLATVRPMYHKYIKNYIHEADVIVANGGRNAKIVDMLAGYLKNELDPERNK